MPHKVRIALDAMGGDHGAAVVVPGAELSLTRHPDIEFLLFGDRAVIEPLLDAPAPTQGRLAARAYRRRGADARQAEPGAAQGALEVLDVARHRRGQEGRGRRRGLRRQYRRADGDGQVRPADHGRDRAAGDRRDLADAAGRIDRARSRRLDRRRCRRTSSTSRSWAAPWRAVLFGLERPTVGLLNIGVEEVKGLEEVREAGRILREGTGRNSTIRGFVEGDDIGKGTVDVVVTEGFSGNIALKAAEGTARQIARFLKQAMSRTSRSKLGYLLARAPSARSPTRWIRARSNGGVFLGLNGIVIKSHGGTDAEGFAYAVDLGYDMVRYDLARQDRPDARATAASGAAPRHRGAAS